MTRKLRVDQKKAAFKNASDKRAVGFLYEAKFDMEDFLSSLKKVLDEAQYKKPASINPIGRNGKVQFQQKCQV